jgi:uncharacterized membrane protein YhaH (DUF805 family)
MNFAQAIRACLSNYATFSGRARRAEYWWFALFGILMQIAAAVLDGGVTRTPLMPGAGMMWSGSGPIQGLVSLALLLPNLAVTVRRLHDTGRSGWWLLIALVPMVGLIVLLVFMVLPGNAGANDYGPDPLQGGAAPPAPTGPTTIPRVPRDADIGPGRAQQGRTD